MSAPLKPFPSLQQKGPKVLLPLALALSLGACGLLKTALELPEQGIRALLTANRDIPQQDPVELQSQLLRFADNYVDAINAATRGLQQEEGRPAEQRTLLRRRITITNDVLAIATGANTYANLLDMVILVTLGRMNVETFWMPKRYGESAKPLLRAAQETEKEIWRIAATALDPVQIRELRAGIEAWHAQHPDGRSPRDVGSLGFAAEIARLNRGARSSATASVFNLLAIDPLSGLDPATRELANTRLLAERGMFLARHMPTLIRWEAQLLAIQTAEMPQTEQLLASTAQLSEAANRLSQTAERLPGLFSEERQQIVHALDTQRPGLTSLAEQIEKSLSAGRQMSDASTATLHTFQDLLRQMDARPSSPDAEPFRINDYTAAAAQINAAAQDLVRLLQAFDRTASPDNFDALATRLEALTHQTQANGQELVDYAFKRILTLGLILIASACAMAVASAVVYAKLKKKLA